MNCFIAYHVNADATDFFGSMIPRNIRYDLYHEELYYPQRSNIIVYTSCRNSIHNVARKTVPLNYVNEYETTNESMNIQND